MTNKERQKKLDEKKWIASEKAKEDLSGLLDYCSHCDWQDIYGCMATQEEIERDLLKFKNDKNLLINMLKTLKNSPFKKSQISSKISDFVTI